MRNSSVSCEKTAFLRYAGIIPGKQQAFPLLYATNTPAISGRKQIKKAQQNTEVLSRYCGYWGKADITTASLQQLITRVLQF